MVNPPEQRFISPGLRVRRKPPRAVFPVDPWAIEEEGFDADHVAQAETAFALANGYLGVRGVHDEGDPAFQHGTFVNGFHDLRPITYGEEAFGFPKLGQTMLNCPDGTRMALFFDEEPLRVDQSELLSYRRRLDFRTGVLVRSLVWQTTSGARLRVASRRLVSLTHRHILAQELEVEALAGHGGLTLNSQLSVLDAPVASAGDPRLGPAEGTVGLSALNHECSDDQAALTYGTLRSGMVLACGFVHRIEGGDDLDIDLSTRPGGARLLVRSALTPTTRLRVTKLLAYHEGQNEDAAGLAERVRWSLGRATTTGFAGLADQQASALRDFWQHADVTIEGDDDIQQVIRWNLFQLLQASWQVTGHGIGARGLTGQVYEGHYFWDTEIYVLPFLIYTRPELARALLRFRHKQLPVARARARELGHPGALFPWRTIDGHEASAYFAAGTAQYHINADIVHALRKYVEVTGDADFLLDYGLDIVIETARLWVDLGDYAPRDGHKFCINGVTGPDEYTAIVNNNYYTNLMARENLRYAVEVVETLREQHTQAFVARAERLQFEDQELTAWREAARQMYLPFNAELGVHPQDDSFLDKSVWDLRRTPADKFPLLLHYHPLTLYRHQVIKQADIVLAMFLLGHEFTLDQKRCNFDYYDPLTTGDSSLSVCIQSIIASEIGYAEQAFEYFRFAATMDFSDIGGNMMHGAHIASIGGSWMALVYGFGGLRDYHGRISFQPRLPRQWQSLGFTLRVRDNQLDVKITADQTHYSLRAGSGLDFHHDGERISLTPAHAEVTCRNGQPEEGTGAALSDADHLNRKETPPAQGAT